MNKKNLAVVNNYKLPFLLSMTLFVVFLALGTLRDTQDILSAFAGAFLGSFILDIEYFLYAYIFEPDEDFSLNLKAFIKHKDFSQAINHIKQHKEDIKDKSLNSALFQITLGLLSIFTVYSVESVLIKTLILSTFANSIYRLLESYFNSRIENWFWAFKDKPSKNGVFIFASVMIIILVFSLNVFST